MDTLRIKILETLLEENGLSDAEIANRLKDFVQSEHPVTNICRQLEQEGSIKRIKRIGKPAGNYLTEDLTPEPVIDMADNLPAQDFNLNFNENAAHVVELAHLGFKKCGEWLEFREKLHVNLDETGDKSNLLYALVIDGTVVYLARSKRSLKNHMNQILEPHTETNRRLYGFIEGLLRRQKGINIYAFEDPGTLQFAGHKISLTAGLEVALIEFFRPTWNVSLDQAA